MVSMEFNQITKNIANLEKLELTSTHSHQKMTPKERQLALENINLDKTAYREAAVLMLLYPKDHQAHLVLMVRSKYPGVHSNQISLPGGKKESFDTDLSQTALRETFEEVGIPSENIQLIRAFSEVYVPPSNFMIHPFLGISTQPLTFTPDVREVQTIIEMPLAVLLDDSNIFSQNLNTSYAEMAQVPYFKYKDYVIWGATAMILSELKDMLLKLEN